MSSNKLKKIILVFVGVILFVGFQNFSQLDMDPIEKVLENKELSKQDVLEKEIDLKLAATLDTASNKYLAQKCFETRVQCSANRNPNKCLHDKIQQYQSCSHLQASSLFGNIRQRKLDL